MNINVTTTALAYIHNHDQLSTGGAHLLFVLQPLQWKKKTLPSMRIKDVEELVSLYYDALAKWRQTDRQAGR